MTNPSVNWYERDNLRFAWHRGVATILLYKPLGDTGLWQLTNYVLVTDGQFEDQDEFEAVVNAWLATGELNRLRLRPVGAAEATGRSPPPSLTWT